MDAFCSRRNAGEKNPAAQLCHGAFSRGKRGFGLVLCRDRMLRLHIITNTRTETERETHKHVYKKCINIFLHIHLYIHLYIW